MKGLYTKLTIAGILCATACCNTQTGDTQDGVSNEDLRAYGLVCPVKSITVSGSESEYPYTAKFGRNGRLSKIVGRTVEGKFRNETAFTYSQDGKLAEKSVNDGDRRNEGRFEYEWEGDCIRSQRFFSGGNNEEIYYIENETDGKRVLSSAFYAEGEFAGFSVSSYGENTRDDINYDADSTEVSRVRYEYAAEGKPTRIYSVESDLDIEIEYDENLLPVHSYNVLIDSNGEFDYDISLIDKPERWYSYTFDRHGNWTERRESLVENGEAVTVIQRKIRY